MLSRTHPDHIGQRLKWVTAVGYLLLRCFGDPLSCSHGAPFQASRPGTGYGSGIADGHTSARRSVPVRLATDFRSPAIVEMQHRKTARSAVALVAALALGAVLLSGCGPKASTSTTSSWAKRAQPPRRWT